jgi:ubiquinone/menaquinone biosynthesis C-methylase UbiE
MSVVVEQFTRQAASFARLPSHEAATGLLLDMAGVSSGDELLDVACGPGLVACAAAMRAKRVVGIDVTPAMIDQARTLQAKLGLANLEWLVGDVASLPFEDASFAAVTTRYSLHHFSDPDVVLAEMLRVAKRGGRVAIADMVLPAPNAVAYDRMERLRDPSHVRTLSRESLRCLAAAAGIRELRCADYVFEIDLERLMRASFPRPGDAERVRAMLEADVQVNAMGLRLSRSGSEVRLAYPVAIIAGTKR